MYFCSKFNIRDNEIFSISNSMVVASLKISKVVSCVAVWIL